MCASSASGDIVPLTVQDPLLEGGQKHYVVDPWIRPPRNSSAQFAIGKEGDFDDYPLISNASPLERITFVHRTIGRTQRHGVYVITNATLVEDYLNGVTDHPCGPSMYTEDAICQVASDTGLNGTNCPNRVTLFPLMEVFGASGAVEYTTQELGVLAEEYGVDVPGSTGKKMVAFDCPWIQGRPETPNTPGRTSHCMGGMYLIAEVNMNDMPKSGGSEGYSMGNRLFSGLSFLSLLLL